jgi:NAD(P)-dependent dehydrogenase (short-subunit alcohol dehydrogenase family)
MWTDALSGARARSAANPSQHICPGVIDTPIFYENDPSLLSQFLASIPLGALGKPYDIASAVAFLASDEAAYLTGTDVLVDGGMLA